MKKDEKEPLNEGQQTTPENGAVVETENNEAQQPEETQETTQPEAGEGSQENPETDQTDEGQTTDDEAPEATDEAQAQQPEEKAAVVAYAIRVDELGHTYLESGYIKSVTETTVEFEEGFTANKDDVFADHIEAHAEIELRTKG